MQRIVEVDELSFRPVSRNLGNFPFWSLNGALDGNDTSLSVVKSVLNGAMLGLAWAVVIRAWMRLVTNEPQFSLTGTGMILAASMIVGACAGLAYAARRRGNFKLVWALRIVSVLSFATLGVGPGVFVAPTVLFATLALVRRHWPVWLRLACAVAALVGFGMIASIVLQFWPPARSAIYLLLFALCLYPPVIAMRMGIEAEPMKAA
jgi:hypothetical protein